MTSKIAFLCISLLRLTLFGHLHISVSNVNKERPSLQGGIQSKDRVAGLCMK